MNTVPNPSKSASGVKLFCSYCHADERFRKRFNASIATLQRKGLVSEWNDRKITPGQDWQAEIQGNLDQAEVIVLLLSPDFLASERCLQERDDALRLRKERKVDVIPVILRRCAWQDDSDISKLQAVPDNGKPISEWHKVDKAWDAVYRGIKEVVATRMQKKRAVVDHFWKRMTSPGPLVMNSGDEIPLGRVFVYPSLTDKTTKIGGPFQFTEVSSEAFARLDEGKRKLSLITGGDQCGKTALCQMLFTSHWNNGLLPVYLSGSDITNDNLDNLVRTRISRQYLHGNIIARNVPDKSKVLIVDDFHKTGLLRSPKMNSLLTQFKEGKFPMVVLVADSMAAELNTMGWEKMEEEFGIGRYSIKSLGYKNRAKVIKKWALASGDHGDNGQRALDIWEEKVTSMIAENHVPDHAFFVLMILRVMHAGGSGSGDKLTSYGHCYHALIFHALTHKGGVKQDLVGTYINILTELAYRQYKAGSVGKISQEEFDAFFASYADEFNVTFSAKEARETLVKSGLMTEDLYDLLLQEYVFYYFVARDLATRLGNDKEAVESEIAEICENAHRKKCSSVILFLIHHAPKNQFLIAKLKENMDALFSDVHAATLAPDETRFFSKYVRGLPSPSIDKVVSDQTRNIARDEKRGQTETRALHQDEMSEDVEQLEEQGNANKVLSDFTKALRMLSIMGQMLKNQHGELPKSELTKVSADTQRMALRVLTWLHSDMENAPELWFVFIEKVLLRKHFSRSESMTHLEKRALSERVFGFLAFKSAHGIIDRISNAVGSDHLLGIAEQVAGEIGTPAAQLVNVSVQGWYGDRLDIKAIDQLAEEWKSENPLAFRVLAEVVRTYVYLRKVDRKTQGQIEKMLRISQQEQNVLGYKRAKRQSSE